MMQTTLDTFYRKRTRLPVDSEGDFSPKRTARKLFETAANSPASSTGRRTKAFRNKSSTSEDRSTKSTPSVSLQPSSADAAVLTSSTSTRIKSPADVHSIAIRTSLANDRDHETNNLQFDDTTIPSSLSTSSAAELLSTLDESRINAREENANKFEDDVAAEDQKPCSSASLQSAISDSTSSLKHEEKNVLSPSASQIDPNVEDPSMPVQEPTTPTRSPSTQTKLRKELNLGEHKKIIRRSKLREPFLGKIQKFEETLASLKETQQSLNDLDRSPQLKRFDLMHVEITSPVKRGLLKPRRLFDASSPLSPAKDSSYISPNKRLSFTGKSPQKASNDRLCYLLNEGREPLALPRKYSILKDTFYWMDTVCQCRREKGQVITFNNIREDVQKASGRAFTENDVAKIKAVYPEAFELSRKKIIVPPSRVANYQLVITMPEKIDLVARQRAFHNCLLEKTKLYHQKFLRMLDLPLEIPNANVKRWHMDFDLNNVPDIEPASLPLVPSDENISYTAKDFLEKASKAISMSKRMESTLTTMAKTESKSEIVTATETVPTEVRAFQKALKGVSPAILAKIRDKQAAKLAEDLTRSSVEVEETRKLLRLPELAKILRLVFVTRGKCVLPEDMVVETVMKSSREKLSRQNLIKHFELITKYVPGWMNTFVMNSNRYIRLSKDADMSRVSGKLETIAKSV